VYVSKRGRLAGVLLDPDRYAELIERLDYLEDQPRRPAGPRRTRERGAVGGGAGVAAEYEARLAPSAARAFRRLHGAIRERIREAIDGLALDPRPTGCSNLAGRDDCRIRVGSYRVVCAVEDAERLVLIARIAQRREVYRR
jgi:mRNA interferase RelE/StbE